MNQSIIKFILAIALLISCKISAQNFYGEATYFSKTVLKKMNFENSKLDPEMAKSLEVAMKKAMEKSYILTFNKFESSYKEEEKLAEPKTGDGMSISFSSSGSYTKSYKNVKTSTTISEEEIFGKEFVVTESLKKWEWKMTDEIKKIGEYTCQKATAIEAVNDEDIKQYNERKAKQSKGKTSLFEIKEPKPKNIVAWYTTEISVSHGPGNYWGLPGLIIEISNGHTTLLCSKVMLSKTNIKEIKIPNNGKKVTRKEFEKIQKEKYDKMKDKDGSVIFQTESEE